MLRMKALVIFLLCVFPQFCFAETAGEKLWTERCGACHSMNPPPKLAPPVRGIVMNYRGKFPDREKFAKAVAAFVASPSQQKSEMPHALTRFSLMPPLPFAESDLLAIAQYMWDEINRSPTSNVTCASVGTPCPETGGM